MGAHKRFGCGGFTLGNPINIIWALLQDYRLVAVNPVFEEVNVPHISLLAVSTDVRLI